MFAISEDGVTRIVKSLNPSKSHGWDNLSVRKIKTCVQSNSYPLKLISLDSLQEGIFPECWKEANIALVHKKENKVFIKNYKPIFEKICE